MTPGTRRDRRAIRIAYLWCAALPLATWFASQARADVLSDYAVEVSSVICTELAEDPTFAGIETVGVAIVNAEGFTFYQAGQIIRTAVTVACPRHTRLLDAYVDAQRPGSVYAA